MAAWHRAAENGDIEGIAKLVASRAKSRKDAFAHFFEDPLNEKDSLDEVTPAYLAILNRQYDALCALLEAGADVNEPSQGNSLLHAALFLGAFPSHQAECRRMVEVVLARSPDLTMKDDRGFTALHMAADLGLAWAADLLLAKAPDALEAKDRLQCRPLHHASLKGFDDVVACLLAKGAEPSPPAALGDTPLHLAVVHGHMATASRLLAAGAQPTAANKRGLTPAAAAAKRGIALPAELAAVLGNSLSGPPPSPCSIKTLVLTHPFCLQHHTCAPIMRGARELPPPENVRRLKVLVDKEVGALRTAHLSSSTEWLEEAPRAAMSDVLRVHDYTYIKKVQAGCAEIKGDEVKNLDGDTAVSAKSFEAAMRAAGAICHAIDQVCSGAHRNAFCVTRPPGHHAGYRGIVEGGDEAHGSAGFCLINNVAVGAAYARSMWRHRGVQRVAIVDFDVHHGNGTEDIVRNLVPSVEEVGLNTPFFTATAKHDRYQPWLNDDDANHVLFVSTHGYGRKETDVGKPWFYPGTGITCGCLPEPPPDGDDLPSPPGASGAFAPLGGAHDASKIVFAKPGEPNVMNVGLGLAGSDAMPGFSRIEWRDAYRRTILPRLEAFAPDLIIISAGFDAHKKDAMNWGYLSLLEDDYAWLTKNLVAMANKCCKGRIVSALEGGYQIGGGALSAFARSVSAHVDALSEGGNEMWDANDAMWESEHENKLLRDLAKRRAMKAEQERAAADEEMAARLAALAAANKASKARESKSTGLSSSEEGSEMEEEDDNEVPAPREDGPPPKRSRRASGAVDYVALAKKLDSEN